ncbi:uncharacterized protein LOC117123426 [Anneissia japonica]|uniref:uncharacterized protein LOC117123426 n=1 Tax=Anneissia japonica TaxID=1529436 RepID=UPI0014254FF7|nr:uncharacterized protein LOC117123426 [Anneissia japonica]
MAECQCTYNWLRLIDSPMQLQQKRGGGVIIYVKDNIKAEVMKDIVVPADLEVLWIMLSHPKFPRAVPYLIVAAVYIPPDSPIRDSYIDHLTGSIDFINTYKKQAGLMIIGDFNRTDTRSILLGTSLKQIINSPTREHVILDLVITNMSELYLEPQYLPAVGRSDHCVISLQPKVRIPINRMVAKTIQPITDSKLNEFGRWIQTQTWSDIVDAVDIQLKADTFLQNYE